MVSSADMTRDLMRITDKLSGVHQSCKDLPGVQLSNQLLIELAS